MKKILFIVNAINKLTYVEGHCEPFALGHSELHPVPHGVQGEAKDLVFSFRVNSEQ